MALSISGGDAHALEASNETTVCRGPRRRQVLAGRAERADDDHSYNRGPGCQRRLSLSSAACWSCASSKLDFQEGFEWNALVHRKPGEVDWPNPNLDVACSEAWVAVDGEELSRRLRAQDHRPLLHRAIPEWLGRDRREHQRTGVPGAPERRICHLPRGQSGAGPCGFVDPNDPKDVETVHALQDRARADQPVRARSSSPTGIP